MISLDNVLMIADGEKMTIGTPQVAGAAVSAEVVRQTRGPKIIIFRRKRRKNHRRTQGHRRDLTLLKISGIHPDGAPKQAAKKQLRQPTRLRVQWRLHRKSSSQSRSHKEISAESC